MNKSFFAVLTVHLLFICSVAEGADWKLYGVDNDKCYYYYDVSSVKTLSKGIKKVLTKMQAKNDKCILYNMKMRTVIGLSIKGYKNYSYTIALGKINCTLEKASTETVPIITMKETCCTVLHPALNIGRQ